MSELFHMQLPEWLNGFGYYLLFLASLTGIVLTLKIVFGVAARNRQAARESAAERRLRIMEDGLAGLADRVAQLEKTVGGPLVK